MKYFTPELLREGNTDNSLIYHEFDEIWDQNIHSYHRYLRSIGPNMPSQIKRLAHGICLHDGEILDWSKSSLSIRCRGVLYYINFTLDETIPAPGNGPVLSGLPFDVAGKVWLYDELQLLAPGRYLFEILTSNGRILRFRFIDVVIVKVRTSVKRRKPDLSAKAGEQLIPLLRKSFGSKVHIKIFGAALKFISKTPETETVQ
jgi:hypothetical protein